MKPGIKNSLVIALVISVFTLVFFVSLRHLESRRRPNIILITLDALRPDHLGCYGYKRNTSPNIDKTAKEGAIFTQVIAQSSHTAPSNASLITSTYPNIHGVKDWGYHFNASIVKTLPVILKEHGYRTAFISDFLAFSLIKGFENGFDTFNTLNTFTLGSINTRKQIIDITDWAIDWVENNRGKNFFLWLYYTDPHGPYIPPYPYDKMFIGDQYYNINRKVPISENNYSQDSIGHIPKYLSYNNIMNANYYISQYDAEIRHIDDQIGRLLQELKNRDLEKNTVIIINSDHGEAMGEHNRYFCHANSLYDELIKIPLIIKWEDRIPSGIKNNTQVSSIDIMPTILDILRIKKYKFMQGNSLLPLLGGQKYTFTVFAYSEFWEKKSVRTQGWKLIYDSKNKQYELYNLKNDPAELNDISAAEQTQFKFLKQKLDEYIKNSASQSKITAPALSQDEKERLKSFGYAQ